MAWHMESLCEDVGNVLIGRYIFRCDGLFLDFFMDPVVRNVDMFCAIGDLIWGLYHMDAGGIINAKGSSIARWEPNFHEQLSKPDQFSTSMGCGIVFSFTSGKCCGSLLFG